MSPFYHIVKNSISNNFKLSRQDRAIWGILHAVGFPFLEKRNRVHLPNPDGPTPDSDWADYPIPVNNRRFAYILANRQAK